MSAAALGEEFHDASRERRLSASFLPLSAADTYRHTSSLHFGYSLDSTDVAHRIKGSYSGAEAPISLDSELNQRDSVLASNASRPSSLRRSPTESYSSLHGETTKTSTKRAGVSFAVDHEEPPFVLEIVEPTTSNPSSGLTIADFPQVPPEYQTYHNPYDAQVSPGPTKSPRTFSGGGNDVSYPDFLSQETAPRPTTPNVKNNLDDLFGDIKKDGLVAFMKILEQAQAEGSSVVDLSTLMRRHIAKRAFAPPAVKDWNRELQELLDMDPCEDKYLKLRELAHDFNLTAEVYAKILISELFLSPSEKTIPPSTIGGLAGGTKFICQGILFKFAVDVQLPDTNFWMYGKHSAATDSAMKAAGSELRHIVALSNAVGDTDLRVPLMALIDYRGFRLVASSLLPISSHTIVYGSDNAGFNIYAQPEAANKFDFVAKRLNLKKHKFADAEISGPVDIEIHKGEDNRLYVIDVARLMPPEAPDLTLIPHPRSNYFKMLRPCLVFSYQSPLSSDAFSGFGRADEEVHNTEVWHATEFLLQSVIPRMAEALSDGKYRVKTGRSLCQTLHKAGINLRYLGLMRARLLHIANRPAIIFHTPGTPSGRRDSVHSSGQSVRSNHSDTSASHSDLTALLSNYNFGSTSQPLFANGTGVSSNAANANGGGTGSGPNSGCVTPTSVPGSPPSSGTSFEKLVKGASAARGSSPATQTFTFNRFNSGPVVELEPTPTPKRRVGTRSQGKPNRSEPKSETSTPSPVFTSPLSSARRDFKEQSLTSKSNDTLAGSSVDSAGTAPKKTRRFAPDSDTGSSNSSSERLATVASASKKEQNGDESSRASLTASRASDSTRTPELPRRERGVATNAQAELTVLRDLENSASLLVLQQPERSDATDSLPASPARERSASLSSPNPPSISAPATGSAASTGGSGGGSGGGGGGPPPKLGSISMMLGNSSPSLLSKSTHEHPLVQERKREREREKEREKERAAEKEREKKAKKEKLKQEKRERKDRKDRQKAALRASKSSSKSSQQRDAYDTSDTDGEDELGSNGSAPELSTLDSLLSPRSLPIENVPHHSTGSKTSPRAQIKKDKRTSAAVQLPNLPLDEIENTPDMIKKNGKLSSPTLTGSTSSGGIGSSQNGANQGEPVFTIESPSERAEDDSATPIQTRRAYSRSGADVTAALNAMTTNSTTNTRQHYNSVTFQRESMVSIHATPSMMQSAHLPAPQMDIRSSAAQPPANYRFSGGPVTELDPANDVEATMHDKTVKSIEQVVLREMIARLLKCRLRQSWRKTMQAHRISIEAPFADVALELLNTVFYKLGDVSDQFWKVTMIQELLAKFSVGLTEEEQSGATSLYYSIDSYALFLDFLKMTGIRISWTAEQLHHPERRFMYTDIDSIDCIVRPMNIATISEGILLSMMASAEPDPTQRIELLNMAESHLQNAYSASYNPLVTAELGHVRYARMMLGSSEVFQKDAESAFACYSEAVIQHKAEFKDTEIAVPVLARTGSLGTSKSFLHTSLKRLLELAFLYLSGSPNLMRITRNYHESGMYAQFARWMLLLHKTKPKEGSSTDVREAAPVIDPVVELFRKLLKTRKGLPMLLNTLQYASETVLSLIASELRRTDVISLSGQGLIFLGSSEMSLPSLLALLRQADSSFWMPNVQTLNLSEVYTLMDKHLEVILPLCPNLKTLILNGCHRISSRLGHSLPLHRMAAVEQLALSRCYGINDEFILEIVDILHSLTYLDVSECQHITETTLFLVGRRASQLVSLNFSGCTNMTNLATLVHFTCLESLECARCPSLESHHIAQFLKPGYPLKRLNVSGNVKIDDSAFDDVISPIMLMELKASETSISAATIEKLVQHARDLTVLEIDDCKNLVLDSMGERLALFTKLTTFRARQQTNFAAGALFTSIRNTLQAVDISVSSHSVQSMLIKSAPANLTSLTITRCNELVGNTLSEISQFKQLTALNMSGCVNVNDVVVATILDRLSGLRTLELAYCAQLTANVISTIGKQCPNLRLLDLQSCVGIDQPRLTDLGYGCRELSELRLSRLNLHHPSIIKSLFRGYMSTLRIVKVKDCQMTDDAVKEIACFSPNLSELDLSDNPDVSDASVKFLFNKCHSLEELQLTGAQLITDDAFPRSSKRRMRSLRVIGLSGCRQITDATISLLTKRSPLLVSLNVSGCNMVSKEACKLLVRTASYLADLRVVFCENIPAGCLDMSSIERASRTLKVTY